MKICPIYSPFLLFCLHWEQRFLNIPRKKGVLSRPTFSTPSCQSVDILCLINYRIMQINAPGTPPVFPQSFINIPKPLEICYSSLAEVSSSLLENQNSSLAKGYSPPEFYPYLCEEKGFDFETFFSFKNSLSNQILVLMGIPALDTGIEGKGCVSWLFLVDFLLEASILAF